MTFQRQVTVRINDVYNLVTNKHHYGTAGAAAFRVSSRVNEGFYFLILKNRSDFDDFFFKQSY
jgi:hypothetical protein